MSRLYLTVGAVGGAPQSPSSMTVAVEGGYVKFTYEGSSISLYPNYEGLLRAQNVLLLNAACKVSGISRERGAHWRALYVKAVVE